MALTLRHVALLSPPTTTLTTRLLRTTPLSLSTSRTTKLFSGSAMASSTRKVLVPIANGTEPMEAVITIDILRRGGADVTVASVEKQLRVDACHGMKIVADALISDCSDTVFDLISLPGGMPGAASFRDCKILESIVKKQAEDGRFYAAICAAPAVALGSWGLLKEKKATCYPSFMEQLSSAATAVESIVQQDGKVVTSRGPGTAMEFSVALVEQLFGKDKANEVSGPLVMRPNHGDEYTVFELNPMEWTFDNCPKVLVPVADGTEEMEATMIIDVLRRAKAEVVVASVGEKLEIMASRKVKLVADMLLEEAAKLSYDLIVLPTGKVVTTASVTVGGKFLLKIEKRTIDFVDYVEADYLLIASGSSKQGYTLATQLGHSIVEPVPSLFTFKIDDPQLAELSGVTFPKVKAKLKLETVGRSIPQLTQVGPMLVTHWGLSGPVILRLSAWGARNLFSSDYEGILHVDFIPDVHIDDVKSILIQHKNQFVKQKVLNWCPSKLGLVKRFWKYILDREGLNGDILWASVSNNTLLSVASLLKQYSFRVKGKGQFKDEFVTAGGVPLSEITLSTMESKIQSDLFFAGEVLNIDGVTGGFNFQNAWSGGYIAGTSIGNLAVAAKLNEEVVR